MKYLSIIAICCAIFTEVARCDDEDLTFPENFIIGAATASYQIEGAWNVSDKGESTWDYFVHNSPDSILDGTNGDIACDSYNKYEEDVQWIRDIGLDFYRFSLSWSRILPNGFADTVSADGIRYYINLLTALKANNISAVVTLYHWDHPQVLEELGGWTNEMMVEWFGDYARIVFEYLGPYVDIFLTVNEPNIVCMEGYNATSKAPAKELANMGHYLCVHNILKAHATAYHIYDEQYREAQQGKIGMTVQCPGWAESENTTEESLERYFQFTCGWMVHPIYIGDYPEIMKTRIAMISELEGYPFSRLPTFSEEWIAKINGTADFFGLNHYTSFMPVFDGDENLGIYTIDSGLIHVVSDSWEVAYPPWLKVAPAGFGNILRKIRDEYDNPPLYVFENGYSETGGSEDYDRIQYFYDYLKVLLAAIKDDGCNVVAYTVWSLLDNFEWEFGSKAHFGIVAVDHDSTNRDRSAKLSTAWWQTVLETRELQPVPTEDSER